VAQTALYIGFGIDAERASEADTLRRTAERADSLARNLQWQATDLRKRLKDLQAALAPGDEPDEDLAGRHRNLLDDQEEVATRVRGFEDQLQDTNLRIANYRAELAAATTDYESAFHLLLIGGNPVRSNPIVSLAVDQSSCSICGAEGCAVSSAVLAHLEAGRCPFCDSELSAHRPSNDEALAEVAALEAKISEYQKAMADEEAAARRIGESIVTARSEGEHLAAEIASFEAANDSLLLEAHGGALEAIGTFQSQIAELMTRKRQQLDRRNAARTELRTLQDELAEAYADAEASFVPRFTQLAHEFLGLDLEIRLQTQSPGVALLLTVQGTTRRVQDSLSESQRFFVDIALRMALSQQMTGGSNPACFYVDTPEGSLDIAYESRAGSMFGQFIASGYQIVMTANINTSQLLIRLASACGPDRMKLMRMTEWTSLRVHHRITRE
jgi:DNA repair exonuclease SbcCD ATPase subunit